MDVGKADALVLLHALGGGLAVAFGAADTDCHRWIVDGYMGTHSRVRWNKRCTELMLSMATLARMQSWWCSSSRKPAIGSRSARFGIGARCLVSRALAATIGQCRSVDGGLGRPPVVGTLPRFGRHWQSGNEMLVRHLPNEIEANISVAVDEAMAHSDDLPPRDIGIASFRIGGDLAGRLTKHFERANDRILVQRLARKAASLRSWTKERASFAANSMSSRSAASRSGKSAIDRLASLRIAWRRMKFRLASTASRSTRSTGRPRRFSSSSLSSTNAAKIVADSRLECHEKVGIAADWIEITAARSRTEDLQAGHAMAAADAIEASHFSTIVSLSGHVRSCLKLIITTDRREMP